MPCCNNKRTYNYSPYPVYPQPALIFENGGNCCNNCNQNTCCPERPVAVANNCNTCCPEKNVFKAATIGNEEVLRGASIPFNFDAFGCKNFIEHYPHDNIFTIKRDGLYEIIYKLSFTPANSGSISFALRKNGSILSETLLVVEAQAGQYTSVTFEDIISLSSNSAIDLVFLENSQVTAITVLNPLIVFRKL